MSTGSYPIIRPPLLIPIHCGVWATEHIRPEHWRRGSLELQLDPDSASSWHVQFWGKFRECCGAIYFEKDPLDSRVINWEHGKPDTGTDLIVGPAPLLRIDFKGSEYNSARLAIYSKRRTDAGLYDKSTHTHLVFMRGGTTSWQELLGWMTKEEFKRRKLVAPDLPPGADEDLARRVAQLKAGTWYVPIEWLHPMIELLPKTRHWMEEVRAYGFPRTQQMLFEMRSRGAL